MNCKWFKYGLGIAFCIINIGLLAQNEMKWWYFGQRAGINFHTNPPSVILLSSMNQSEGCATVSRKSDGKTLFYTDGITVWDRNHRAMPNGYGLYGSATSSQSACIVPHPGDTNIFYVLSVPYPGSKSLYTAEVNMTLNGGFGDVDTTRISSTKTKKYYPLLGTSPGIPITDKVAFTEVLNKNEYWVIVQDENTWNFKILNLKSTGWSSIILSAPTPKIPQGFPKVPTFGCMKFSPNGRKFAVSYGPAREVHLYDFNPQNGSLLNQRIIKYIPQGSQFLPYGIEFSANSKYLYVSSYGVIQFNTDLDSSADISASGIMVSDGVGLYINAQLQLGPNKKIYFTRPNLNQVDAIDLPNNYGPYCKYRTKALTYSGFSQVKLGLPVFNAKPLSKNEIEAKDVCLGDSAKISISDTSGIDSVHYNFGEPSSGAANFSRKIFSKHRYSNEGSYRVRAISFSTDKFNNIIRDTIYDSVSVFSTPQIALGSDTVMCTNDTLFAQWNKQRFTTKLWDDSSSFDYRIVARPGVYWVEAKNKCGSNRATVKVLRMLNQGLNLGPDTVLCPNEWLNYNISDTLSTYQWENGSTSPVRSIRNPGRYWAMVTNFCGVYTDTVEVDTNIAPFVDLGPDTAVCSTAVYYKVVAQKGCTYLWQDSSNLDAYRIKNTGKYWVLVKNQCGTASDTFNVIIDEPFSFIVGDTNICVGDSIWAFTIPLPPNPVWHDGTRNWRVRITGPGKIWCTGSNSCGVYSDSGKVDTLPRYFPKITYRDSIFECDRQGGNYLWYYNDKPILGAYARRHLAYAPGRYKVLFTNSWRCEEYSNEIELDENGNIVGVREALHKMLQGRIYPNPTTHSFFVELPASLQEDAQRVVLFNYQGEVCRAWNFNLNKAYELDKLSSGIYFIQVLGSKAQILQNYQLIKQ